MFGEHHGGGFEHFDIVVAVEAFGAVLHDKDAEDVAAAAGDRHGEQRVIDLLARFGAVGERWMVLGVRLVDGLGEMGAQADQAFAAHHEGGVFGSGIEAFGGEQFEAAVLPLEVDRADVRDHVAGHLPHDRIEARLTVARLAHDLTQPAHEDAQRGFGAGNTRVITTRLLHARLLIWTDESQPGRL